MTDIAPHTLSIAPMMEWTDRHFRYLFRQISRHALLYTEMVHHDAILHNQFDEQKRDYLLGYHPQEQPLAFQIGGSDRHALVKAAEIIQGQGYQELNLNCGCPSPKVKKGAFGAVLMHDSDLVAELVKAMQDKVGYSMPVTVKHRLGVIEGSCKPPYEADYGRLYEFVSKLVDVGVTRLIVHARLAVLEKLSPKQNRDIPPLDYQMVTCLKQDFPACQFILNGGVTGLNSVKEALKNFDGVMVGRAAYKSPFTFLEADPQCFKTNMQFNRSGAQRRYEIIMAMADYCDEWIKTGGHFRQVARHMLGLYAGEIGAGTWRRQLTKIMQDSEQPTYALRQLASDLYKISSSLEAA